MDFSRPALDEICEILLYASRLWEVIIRDKQQTHHRHSGSPERDRPTLSLQVSSPAMIDLRSDTVSQPTADMRRAIAEAVVGDDVFHDDPTVLELEERVASLLGKEDAIYLPTGTMTNQVAIRTHTSPGDVILAAEGSHIAHHELGAAALISGVTIQELPSQNGRFEPAAIEAAFPELPDGVPDSLLQPVTLLEVENTHMASGGHPWPLEDIEAVAEAGKAKALALHLDGARLWNAAAATGVPESQFAREFDTVSVCFSKGLGAPMGSALVGSASLIHTARRFKQTFGGGFRQAGMMAAGALHALEHHRERLVDDHANARRLGEALRELPGYELVRTDPMTGLPPSNMVFFKPTRTTALKLTAACRSQGLLVNPDDDVTIRAVCHIGITAADIDETLEILKSVG